MNDGINVLSTEHPTGMQYSNTYFNQQKKNKDVYDIIKTGQMQGVVKVEDVHFAIICDTIINKEVFGKAAQAFLDNLTGGK